MLPVLGSRATAYAWHRLSPKELLTGIKAIFTRDLRIGFLDYIKLTEPVNETTYNSLKPRTRGGVALYSLGNTKGSVIFMTLKTRIEVAREKFHLLPVPDVVTSHLNAVAAKDKKTISANPVLLFHGLVIPDDIPYYDAGDTHFSPLPTEAPVITGDHSFYSTDDHDSANIRKYKEIEETHMSESPRENQQTEKNGGVPITTEEIGGTPTEKCNDDSRKDNKDTIVKEIKTTKPKVQFVRGSYMLRERKPTGTVLATLANDNSKHSYNLSIKNALETHGDIAVKALMFESARKINFPSCV